MNVRSDPVRQSGSLGSVAANRLLSLGSTVGIGGSIAAIVIHYYQVPEEISGHVAALVVFGWHTTMFLVEYAWRRWAGEML
jgi:hypothetical protein